MDNNKKHWAEFYEKHRRGEEPSAFARYVVETYLLQGRRLLELGCGNGRDALFLASKGILTVGIDQIEEQIKYLNSLKPHNAEFVAGDFSELGGYQNFDYVYSRFSFHSIEAVTEDAVMGWLPKVLSNGGLFLLEARSVKDECLNKEFGDQHYRRYLDLNETVDKIAALGFEILEKQEAQGLAPYKSEDPFVLRVIARKV